MSINNLSVIKNNIRYCLDENEASYSVGCGSHQDAIADNSIDLSTIIIPEKIYNKDITKINSCAFEQLKTIRIVQIYAKITRIEFRAFDQCSGIERINIPATVTYIGGNALCLSNNGPSGGTVHIYFEPGSQLSQIGDGGISSKETMIISYCGQNSMNNCGSNIFSYVVNPIIYSPNNIEFCSIQSTQIKEQALCLPYPPKLPNTPCITLYYRQIPTSYIIHLIFLIA